MELEKSKKKQKELIEQVINLLKEHHIVDDLFKKFDIDPESIHNITIDFDDIDVSAKAKKDKIVLNNRFLEDGNIIDDLHYIVHELVHVLQYLTGYVEKAKNLDFDHYLDNPLELQAFKEQIRFIRDYKGEKAAEKYLKDLLDFHEIKGKDRKNKETFLAGL